MPKPCMTACCPPRENFEIVREEATRSNTWSMTCGYYPSPTRASYRSTFRQWNHSGSFRMSPPRTSIRHRRKNVALELDIASPLPAIEVDPGRMTQVLTNILDNALRHTLEGGRLSSRRMRSIISLNWRYRTVVRGWEKENFSGSSTASIARMPPASVMAPFPAARGWDWRSPNPLSRRTAGSYPRRVTRQGFAGHRKPAKERPNGQSLKKNRKSPLRHFLFLLDMMSTEISIISPQFSHGVSIHSCYSWTHKKKGNST